MSFNIKLCLFLGFFPQITRMCSQGADTEGIQRILTKMINPHWERFVKFDLSSEKNSFWRLFLFHLITISFPFKKSIFNVLVWKVSVATLLVDVANVLNATHDSGVSCVHSFQRAVKDDWMDFLYIPYFYYAYLHIILY